MPRMQEAYDDGGFGYHLICDQCSLQSPSVAVDETVVGFEQPPDTVGIFLCESCARMDVGQEDWLLRFPSSSLTNVDQRINLRAQIETLRADPNVRQVHRVAPRGVDVLYVMQLVQLARQPHDEELIRWAEDHRTYRYDQREPTPLVERLIAGFRDAQQQENGVEMDFRPGSNLRLIVETVAMVIESGLTSLERTGEDVFTHLTTQLGHAPGPNLIGLIEGLVGRAYEDHRPRTTQEIREAVIRAYPTLQRRHDPASMGSMINPIRQRIDYTSVARGAFMVDQLPETMPSEQAVGGAWKVAILPEWCKVGLWVKRRLDNLTARIEVIKNEEVLLLTFDLPGDWQGVMVWDRTADGGKALIENVWEPTTRPLAPTSWERILEGVL